jgi:hypothetical protein
MKRFILILIPFLILGGIAWGQNFTFRIDPVYKTWDGLNNFEAGSSLLRIKTQLKSNSGLRWVSGLQCDMGFEAVPGYEVSKLHAVAKDDQLAGSWAGLGTPLNYYNATGNATYTKAAQAGTTGPPHGLNVTESWHDIYQINFEIPDGLSLSTANEIKFRPVGDTQNQCRQNWGPNSLTQLPFMYNIHAAAAPVGFGGPTGAENALHPNPAYNTAIGNTIKINWIALSNEIGRDDLTPPIRYDIYRSKTSGFTPSDDPTTGNRVLRDITPSTVIDGPDVYKGGSPSSLDGPNNGIPGSTPNRLSDCEIYYYKMRAKDDTRVDKDGLGPPFDAKPPHKTKDADRFETLQVKPHDYTAPDPVAWGTFSSEDKTVRLRWTNPSDLDFDGVIIAMKPGAEPSPALTSASGDDDGQLPPDVGTPLSDGSVVVYKETGGGGRGAVREFPVGNLNNGASYTFKAFTFDVATGRTTDPRQQGYNYRASAAQPGTPGVAPGMVQNFVALSGGDGITLRWKYPPEDWYGGGLVIGTVDVTKWNDLQKDSHLRDPDVYKLVSNVTAVTPRPDPSETIVNTFGGAPMDKSGAIIYYFKVFSYNSGDAMDPASDTSISAHQLSAGAAAGARVAAGGGGPVTYNFRRATDGLGLNAFAILHDLPLSVWGSAPGGMRVDYTNPVNTIADLTAAINAVSGANNTTAIGWLGANNQLEGYYVTYDASGAPTFSPTSGLGTAAASEITLTRGRAYQVSVIRDVDVTLSGR